MWEILPALPTEINNLYIPSCRGWYFFPPWKSANKHTYPSPRGHAEKHPSEPLFKKNRRLKKLVGFCGEENNLYIFHSITNIYTRDCICFHVQAQSGWQNLNILEMKKKVCILCFIAHKYCQFNSNCFWFFYPQCPTEELAKAVQNL